MIPLFYRFLSQLADALVSLLEGGAAREPEIIEQVYIYTMPSVFTYQVTDIILDVLFQYLMFHSKAGPCFLQIFTSWSYIMMYLQKYLTRNITDLLR